nr:hypothetical protein [Lachnospiraceae bacterium]
MEVILEFLFELILEGSVELSTNHKVPKPLRILAVIILLIVYCGLILIVGTIMMECWQAGNMVSFAIVTVIGLGIILMLAYAARKKYKLFRERKEEIVRK